MFREEKNLKDSVTDLGITVKDSSLPIAYTKTNKLIMALYMVTDILDPDEPLRNKLRTLGTDIISDINSTPVNALKKISEIMSFLDIASAVSIISEMNCNILRKEFVELNQAIIESKDKVKNLNRQINLSEFFREELPAGGQPANKTMIHHIGHPQPTRIGVQKGSTLLKAIKQMSNKMPAQYEAGGFRSGSDKNSTDVGRPSTVHNFDILKKQRREEIISFIKKNGGHAIITDIKKGASGSLLSCSEKTLQRELVSMVKDGVLNKTGEKRWSQYVLK